MSKEMLFLTLSLLLLCVSGPNLAKKSLFHTIIIFTDRPVCLPNQRNVYGVSAGESAQVSCKVDGNPVPDSFIWMFNTTMGGMDLSKNYFTIQVFTS